MTLRRIITSRLLPVLALCCLWAPVAGANGEFNLPALGEPANTVLTPQEERHLGSRVVSQMLQADHIVDDVELRRYLQHIGTRLIQPTRHDPKDFHFFVVRNQVINAFALPGGYIGINAGLITQTDDESELASVMAHETAHVTQRHIARQIKATKGSQWTTLAALLAAALATGGNGDAIEAAITGSISALRQKQVNFTRAHEAEADHIGIRMLAAADYDPKAMAEFFETMQRKARLYGHKLPQILLTHPVTSTRIADARARAKDYPNPDVEPTPDYALMKERARVLTSHQYSDLLKSYRQQGAPDSGTASQDYGYALVLIRTGEAAQAVTILRRLMNEHPEQLHYVTALSRALRHDDKTEAAIELLDKALTHFDTSPAVKLAYADALLDAGQAEKASDFLKDHDDLTRHSDRAQQILSQAASRLGKVGEAYYRQALYHRLRGAYVPAIRGLRSALHNNKLSTLEAHRLNALLDQIISQCKTAWPGGQCRDRVLGLKRRG